MNDKDLLLIAGIAAVVLIPSLLPKSIQSADKLASSTFDAANQGIDLVDALAHNPFSLLNVPDFNSPDAWTL